ncbi:MAG: M20/M25/M40 family metallo-hydrolase [Sporomusaceae bacterium]|nr:M20/M25/M40 family metallo-hydrolase [Sporomusaceae bacterium]
MDSKQVKDWVEGRLNPFIDDLKTITNIDSGNGDPEGTGQVARIIGGWLEAAGAAVEYRSNDRSTHTIARIKGSGKVRLLLIAHIDTVFAKGEAAKRPFTINADLIAQGPGVGDDKATVIQTIYTMKALQELGFDNFGEIILYYNGEEEGGSPTADAIVAELSQQADLAVIMDTARPNWGIVTQRKGSANYEIEVQGIAGHHGNSSHHSASAIMELGNQISRLYRLASPLPDRPADYTREALAARGVADHGQFIPENTINVGVIGSSNQKINVIPQDAFAKLNVRCFKVAEQERLDREIKALATQTMVPGTSVAISGGIETGPMEKTEQVQKLVDLYKTIVKREYNADVVEWIAGGITDGNRSAKYIPTIDALGIENYDEHTDHETVDLKTAVPRTVALILFIQEVSQSWPL